MNSALKQRVVGASDYVLTGAEPLPNGDALTGLKVKASIR